MCFEQRVVFLWLVSLLWSPTERLLGKWAFGVVSSDSVKRDARSDPSLALK